MAVSEIAFSYPFLSELRWAEEMIQKIREYKIQNRPIGINPESGQPDDVFVQFARRDLALEPYVSVPALSIGSPDAYMHNISAIINYISQRRLKEIRSAHDKMRQILSLKAQLWPVGLSWPDGQPDSIAAYFALRGLPVACYVRGQVNVGDESAYDKNVAALKDYVMKIGGAQVR